MAVIRLDLGLSDSTARPPESGAVIAGRLALAVLRSPLVLLGLIAVGAMGWWVQGQYALQQAEHTRLLQQVEQAVGDSLRSARELQEADNLKRTQQEVEQQLGRITSADGNRYGFLHLADAVAAALPPDSWLQGIETDKEDPANRNVTVIVRGVMPSERAVTEFLTRLQDSRWVGEAALVGSSRIPLGRQSLTRFEVSLTSTLAPVEFWNTSAAGTGASAFGGQLPAGIAPGVLQNSGLGATPSPASVFAPAPAPAAAAGITPTLQQPPVVRPSVPPSVPPAR